MLQFRRSTGRTMSSSLVLARTQLCSDDCSIQFCAQSDWNCDDGGPGSTPSVCDFGLQIAATDCGIRTIAWMDHYPDNMYVVAMFIDLLLAMFWWYYGRECDCRTLRYERSWQFQLFLWSAIGNGLFCLIVPDPLPDLPPAPAPPAPPLPQPLRQPPPWPEGLDGIRWWLALAAGLVLSIGLFFLVVVVIHEFRMRDARNHRVGSNANPRDASLEFKGGTRPHSPRHPPADADTRQRACGTSDACARNSAASAAGPIIACSQEAHVCLAAHSRLPPHPALAPALRTAHLRWSCRRGHRPPPTRLLHLPN